MSGIGAAGVRHPGCIEVNKKAGGGVAVAEVVEEGWAVWGWELADDSFEFYFPGGVRRPGLGPALMALGHWVAPLPPRRRTAWRYVIAEDSEWWAVGYTNDHAGMGDSFALSFVCTQCNVVTSARAGQ